MKLIILTGLPGTGKSQLAETIGRELGIPVFSKDWLEATLRHCGLGQDLESAQAVGYAGYELLTVLASRQLRLGQSAILDSVASFERVRAEWRKLAATCGADWRVIECICSDESLHRARLTERQRGLPGGYELTWADVERVKSYYEPWVDERLILDAASPFAENSRAALSYLRDA